MNRPNPYINTLYLAVHFALNLLVVAIFIKLIDFFFPVSHIFSAYHIRINFHAIYPPTTFEKNIAAALAVGLAIWYYYKRKAKNSESHYKYHLPTLREMEDYIRSKF